MPPEIEALGQQFLGDPARVKAPQSGITADKLHVTLLAEGEKRDRLCDILHDQTTGQALIFVRTSGVLMPGKIICPRFCGRRVTWRYAADIAAKSFAQFSGRGFASSDRHRCCPCGIDVAGLSHVVNFDLTDTPEAYVHRIGRTGRAGLWRFGLVILCPRRTT